MKKKIMALCLICLMGVEAYSNTRETRRIISSSKAVKETASSSSAASSIYVAPVIGINLAQQSNKPGKDYSFGVGLAGGALAGMFFSPMWGIETGLMYVRRVSKLEDTSIGYGALEVPVTARIKLSDMFSVGVGGFVAFGMGEISQTQNGQTQTNSFDNAGAKKIDAGAEVSARVLYPIQHNLSILGDVKYQHGFINLVKDAQSGQSSFSNNIRVVGGVQYQF